MPSKLKSNDDNWLIIEGVLSYKFIARLLSKRLRA